MANGSIQVKEFRVSFIWTESVLGVLTGAVAPTSIPRPEVCDRTAYAAYFDNPTGELGRPWPGRFQGFWDEYLEHMPLPDVAGQHAYRQLVPLRAPNAVAMRPAVDQATASAEGLLYPWGTALIVTVRFRHPWSDFEKPVETANEIRREAWFSVDGQPGRLQRLDEVAAQARVSLRSATFGNLAGSVAAAEPFSIHTVVRASGPRAGFAPSNEAVHRFLHGVTSFSPSWKTDQLPAIDEATVAGRRSRPPDHIIYGRRRGRALWGPDNSLKSSGKAHALGCQHRNLVLASAHIESVAGFAVATAKHLRETGGPVLATHRMLAKRAGVALAQAYHGTNTYRSGSIQHQIESNGWLPDIEFVRAQLEQPPIVAAG